MKNNKKVIVITDEHNFDQVLTTLIVDEEADKEKMLATFDKVREEKGVSLKISDLLEIIETDFIEMPHNWLSI